MKRTALISALTVVFLMLTLMIGCSNESTTMSGVSDDLNLTTSFGGYDDSDELPAFGDEMVAELAKSDPGYNDPLLPTAAGDSLCDSAKQVYMMNIRWGQLEFDSTSTTPTDWTGSLQLKYGVIRVYRPLLFERGQDELIRPRPDRQTIEWTSQTTTHYDGVVVAIIVPPTPEGEDWSDNSLTFTTPPYTREFAIGDLTELDEIVDVDALGNQVAFNAKDLALIPCGGGSLDGQWVVRDSAQRGHFFGRWMSDDGLLFGHLRGHFGTTAAGEQIFFGKYIGLDGRFHGFLRGTWGASETPVTLDDDTEVYEGWFAGDWISRSGQIVGTVEGQWTSAAPDSTDDTLPVGPGNNRGQNPREHPVFGSSNSTAGFFSGTWSADCDANDGDGES